MEKWNFKPFDKVLVRSEKENHWEIDFFGRIDKEHEHHYIGTAGCSYVECIPYNNETAHLLGTTYDYVEPYEPKDGEFVTYTYPNGNKYVAIYEQKESDSIDNYYVDVSLSNNIKAFENKTSYNYRFERGYSEIRPSTDFEKQQLLDAMQKAGKQWNPEKKCVEDIWEPKAGDFIAIRDMQCQCVYIAICKNYSAEDFLLEYYVGTISRNTYQRIAFNSYYSTRFKTIRSATEEEKQLLLDAIHKEGKQWNAEKKCVEDIWKPKAGDFVVSGWSEDGRFAEWVAIVKCVKEEGCNYTVNAILFLKYSADAVTSTGLKYDGYCNAQDYTRIATDSEKQQLLDAMHKAGKDWDAEKMEVVKYKWKPKYGEDYFTLGFERCKGGFYVLKTRWTDEPDDLYNAELGLVFRTKEEAKKGVDKRNELLKGE